MSESISTAELADLVVYKTGIRKKTAIQILRVLPEIIEEGLRRDGESRVKGMGTFRMVWISDRTGRNPKSGEKVLIPAHYKISFLPEQSFKEYINLENRLLSYELVPTDDNSLQDADIAGSQDEITTSTPLTDAITVDQYTPEPSPIIEEKKEMITPVVTKRRIHWIIPAVIILVAALSVIFYFRNFDSGGRLPETGGRQESAVSSQQPVPNPPKTVEVSAVGIESDADTIPHSTFNIQHSTSLISSEGKHLFQLAREVYGNPFLWVLIYKENAEKIPDPDHLISGKELVVPTLEGNPDGLTHTDSLNVAEGYRMVSEFYRQKGDVRARDFEKAFRRFQP